MVRRNGFQPTAAGLLGRGRLALEDGGQAPAVDWRRLDHEVTTPRQLANRPSNAVNMRGGQIRIGRA